MLYMYDKVVARPGTINEETGDDYSGIRGMVSQIGYRDEAFPIHVDVRGDDGYTSTYYFAYDELELLEEN